MKAMTVAIAVLVLAGLGCTSANTSPRVVSAQPVAEARPQALARSFDFEPVTITGELPGRSFHFDPVTVVVKPGSTAELALAR